MAAVILLRKAGPDDAVAVGALTRAAYGKWVPVIGREPLPMQADPVKAIALHRVDLLEDAGKVLALIETYRATGHLWVENLAVDPDAQGRGLGTRLMGHAETLARACDLFEMRLLTNPAFTGNLAFYQRLGFVIDRQEPFLGGSTAYLSKRLTAS